MLEIVNAAAEAYRGVIPADRWQEPYMPAAEFDGEIASGVTFWGYEAEGALVGVMGVQAVDDVDLIRHAYVLPQSQGGGVGGALLDHLRPLSSGPDARRHLGGRRVGDPFLHPPRFRACPPHQTAALLRRYWTIPERQIETSVVLADPPYCSQA